MIAFAKRNLKLFFRDKSSVFFSLLSVLIVLGLYVLFLGDQLVSSMKDITGANRLMDSWIMAGILAITPVSTTLGSFGTIVSDKSKKIDKDFRSSPIKNRSLAAGYIISSFCIGCIMSLFALAVIEIYFACKGYALLSGLQFLQTLGVMLLSVLTSSAMMYLVVSLFHTQNAFATASTIIGTLIGFVTGIYLPIGSTDQSVQYVIEFFPISHAASLFRKILMADPMTESFKDAPDNIITDFKREMGVEFRAFDHTFTSLESIGYLLLAAVVFYTIGIIITAKKKK